MYAEYKIYFINNDIVREMLPVSQAESVWKKGICIEGFEKKLG